MLGYDDPREHGSKNPGATNVLRLYGKRAALATLTGDLLKGLVPVLVGKLLGMPHIVLAAIGMAAFLGHLFPIFFKFKGGKGIATFIGVIYGFAWPLGVFFMLEWAVIAYLFKYSSLAALVAASTVLIAVNMLLPAPYYLIACLIMVALIFWRHKTNIQNLLNGTEGKLGKKKKSEEVAVELE
jgi:glycerol-3-phosphate acyltransferase PlsY